MVATHAVEGLEGALALHRVKTGIGHFRRNGLPARVEEGDRRQGQEDDGHQAEGGERAPALHTLVAKFTWLAAHDARSLPSDSAQQPQAGFVTTQRGAGGGIRLARPAETITLGEVVRRLEDCYDMVECFRADGGACLLNPLCRLKPQLVAAREAFLAELDKTSIADCTYPGPPPDRRKRAPAFDALSHKSIAGQ